MSDGDADLRHLIGHLIDRAWYVATHRDVREVGADPAEHFIGFGAAEGRNPNPYFDGAWYVTRYPDVQSAGMLPIVHYMVHGAAEMRDPHPSFDAVWYADAHPAAAPNVMMYHVLHGARHGFPTRHVPSVADYLPAAAQPLPPPPPRLRADVVIPVYRGLEDTRACLDSVLADPARVPGRIIVIDDCSPDPAIVAMLDAHAEAARITLVRNPANLGFVRSVNEGMRIAAPHDVILLNSDTVVPHGWTRRLAAHAYAARNIASVSPFSNNATICSYPRLKGGPPAFGMDVAALDAACAAANPGRSLPVPVTVGFAMYIRRAAIATVGAFDADKFGRGYGEETDFCLRAEQKGWVHRLAPDVYVHHTGEVSFGPKSAEAEASRGLLRELYPDYEGRIARHVRLDPANPARFALTTEIFRTSGLPVIAFVCHALGGGVRLHARRLAASLTGRAHVVMVEAGVTGVTLSIPQLQDHPVLTLDSDRAADVLAMLRAMAVSRVHLHHIMGSHTDLRALIADLGVPFDVTIHDWYTICPQVNLLPQLDQMYCGEPAIAVCNACIRQRPGNNAADITGWRAGVRWMAEDAARVIVPSEDARRRLVAHGLGERAIVAAHEPVPAGEWRLAKPPPIERGILRVLLLGVLADQKGARVVEDVARMAPAAGVALSLIGAFEREPDDTVASRVASTGAYQPDEVAALIAESGSHVAWFPAQWPETYSYTLSEALAAGLPILASQIGAFPERLAGRPLTWLLPPDATAEDWIIAFGRARAALRAAPKKTAAPRPASPDFYGPGGAYLGVTASNAAGPAARRSPRDLRRPGRTTLIVIPERMDGGAISPCGYIRLMLPLTHPDAASGIDIVTATADEARHYRADAVVTQRYAVSSVEQADALAAHCAAYGMRLLYDLDDDLLDIPPEHPEAATLRPRARIIRRMLTHASAVTVSTEPLREALGPGRTDALVVPNGLDERLWAWRGAPVHPPFRDPVLRVLLMGTATHGGDLAVIEPALDRLRAQFGARIEIGVIGMVPGDLPAWARRVEVPANAGRSYPAFVSWLTSMTPWHVGLTPLADTRFNASKSAIKTLDFAALGLAVLASDVQAYQSGIASGSGGRLLPPEPDAWYAAISLLLRDPARWRAMADAAHAAWLAEGTLVAQAVFRRATLRVLAGRDARDTAAA